MSAFINLLTSTDKESDLLSALTQLKSGRQGHSVFVRDADYFSATEDCAILYSMPAKLYEFAIKKQTLSRIGAQARQGNGAPTRYHRLWWEVLEKSAEEHNGLAWPFMAHGTPYSPFYKASYFRFKWGGDGAEAKADIAHRYPYLNGNYGFKIQAEDLYFKPGLCYGKRTSNFSVQVMPSRHLFSFEGTAISTQSASVDAWVLLGLLNSKPVSYWLSLVCAQHKAYNYLQALPVPNKFDPALGLYALEGWSLMRLLNSVEETSNAFLLPEFLQNRLFGFDRLRSDNRLSGIKEAIDVIAFDLYGLSAEDQEIINRGNDLYRAEDEESDEDDDGPEEDVEQSSAIELLPSVYSWACGVAFGRFDWRLATGERAAPAEPEPFDPLPAKSPGMLPDGATPFHVHAGILVDDQGHPHDLAHLIEEVLALVDVPVPEDVRRWLQRDFFAFHLQRYSKSRRKAPIYWPLATSSGSYTLWVYYPSLTSQTLYTAINDFLEPKLKQVGADVTTLRNKGSARSRDDEKQFEAQQAFELELIELRDTLLKLAPKYKPQHDDGVQISAAPLWPLFRHKPWQKALKDTWAKLEKGDYDWAHLAMNYWPERVREKCKTDKSLAIAHGLEKLYVKPEAKPKKTRGKKSAGAGE
ncbi:MAG: BREX-1 system adenine-specific DNA-methyltransferase PglX [Acidithiobacillus sp.]